jgi:hypothetical protein
MVGPEPDQALNNANVGADGGLVARGRLILENLLGQCRRIRG